MLKKIMVIITLFSFILAFLHTQGTAYARNELSVDGKINNNRMLVPLRVISEHFHAKVKWNQLDKTITITTEERSIFIKVNSRVVTVDDYSFLIDVPAQVENGTTYVPLRFLSQSLGGKISWNQQTKQATLTSREGAKVIIQGVATDRIIEANQISSARLKQLNAKLNEALDLSSFSQIRAYFKPYFTDALINKLVQNNGLEYDYSFIDENYSVLYTSDTTALYLQSSEFDKDSEYYNSSYFLTRNVQLVFVDGIWKVDGLLYSIVEKRY